MTNHAVPGRLGGIGRDLQSRLKRFFDTPLDGDATPLEIGQAVLDEIETKVQPVGRGRRIFPYTRVVVEIRHASPDRASLDAAFEGFTARVIERLREIRCEMPARLDVSIAPIPTPPSTWGPDRLFAIRYEREAQETPRPADASLPPLQITVIKGAAATAIYTFTDPVISIGRTAEPTDGLGRTRRNRIAFLDTVDGVTETVGRAHARLRFDAASGGYQLFDEGSSNGTSVIRGGEIIPVPPRDPRGVRLRSGDEIQVGKALLLVEVK